MYRPGNWYRADDSRDITFTGSTVTLEPMTSGNLVIESMADLTRAITTNQLTIRTANSAGNIVDQVVEYPVVTRGLDGGLDLTGGATVTFDSNVTTDLVLGTGTIHVNYDGDLDSFVWPMRKRTHGRTLHRRNHRGMAPRADRVDFSTATPAELTALQLLRQLVGQDEFRRYLKYGFVMVAGASGLRYQIERGRHVVNVWNGRRRVDGICVYLSGSFPPTDGVITRMLMAERDELELWKRGNSAAGRDVTPVALERLYCDGRKVAA